MNTPSTTKIKNAQYEIPAIAAGVVRSYLASIDDLIRYHQEQHGNSPMLNTARGLIGKAQEEAVTWQRTAQVTTDYAYARELVLREGTE